jgi:hypothetical protein
MFWLWILAAYVVGSFFPFQRVLSMVGIGK